MFQLNNEDKYLNEQKWNNNIKTIIFLSYSILLSYLFLRYLSHNNSSNINYVKNYETKGKIPNEFRKVIVYSCLIGNYDNVTTFNRQSGYDYILFTDQKIVNTNWSVLPIPPEVEKLKISDIKKQRYIKIHPHKFFKNYDLSIYIDANYIIKGDLDDFLLNTLNPIDNIYIPHYQRGKGVKRAIEKAIEQKKDKFSLLNETLQRYSENSLLDKKGIVNAGLIVRKHHKKDCIELMDKWWEEVKNYSHVDNFAFNYAVFITGIRFLYISYQFTLDYFDHNEHLIKIDY